jgi:glycosyltransferase involved in cell wall biosynthesis
MKIDFYTIDAFEVPNYEPIWRNLNEMGVEARIVGVPCDHNVAKDWFDFDRFKQYCTEKAIPYFTEINPDADFAITTQNANILREYRCPKSRIMYGPIVYPLAWGLQKHSVQPFDAILTHSQLYADFYYKWLRPEQLPVVGYPRYDDYFAGKLKRHEIRARWGVNDKSPVVAFLPTWGDNTGFDKFFPALLRLAQQYQIILRPHHCTLRFEPKRMELLKSCGLPIIDNAFDLAEIYAGADIIVSDTRSGGLFEAVICNTPTVGMVVDPTELSGWLAHAKVEQFISLCSDPEQLETAIHQALSSQEQANNRRHWAEEHCAYRDGTSGHQAAKALIKLIEIAAARNTHPNMQFDKSFQLHQAVIKQTNLDVN